MTYTIDLNFGRTRQVDPTNGMTLSEFDILTQHCGIVLDGDVTRRKNGYLCDLIHYYNLWDETMKQNRKCGQAYDFDAYITWMKTQ